MQLNTYENRFTKEEPLLDKKGKPARVKYINRYPNIQMLDFKNMEKRIN